MKFNESILVLADMGELKAYRVKEINGMDPHESAQVSHMQHHGTEKKSTILELIEDLEYIDSHVKSDKRVSDQAGRFDTSTGEAHNTQREQEKRTLHAISEDIQKIIEKEAPSAWYLSFPKELHNELRDMLNNTIKATLKKSLPSDLTKTPKEKILSHFE